MAVQLNGLTEVWRGVGGSEFTQLLQSLHTPDDVFSSTGILYGYAITEE